GYDAFGQSAPSGARLMPDLVRTLRLRDLLLLFIGSVIGSGIFRTPGPILRQVNGSVGLSLLVWVAGGVLFLLGALTFAGLAAANLADGALCCYLRYGYCGYVFLFSAFVFV